MSLILSSQQVTTGAQLRQFVLDLLRARGLHQPGSFTKFPLDDYLGSLWQAAQSYRDRPFRYYFIAELLALAFDTPPMPHDWEAELQSPYRPVLDHLAPYGTPEYYAEGPTYELFERRVKRQILELKHLKRQPLRAPLHDVFIDGVKVYWENTDVENFLERATINLEEQSEAETETTWGYLSALLSDGQYTE